MPDDATRLPQGIVIDTATLAVARPVGTIVYDTGTSALYRSTNATVATYVAIGTSGTFPQGTSLTFATGTGTLIFTGGAVNVVVTDTGGVGLVFGDSVPVSFGTGIDVTFTANGTDVVLAQGAGAGLLLLGTDAFRIADSTDTTKRVWFLASGITAGQSRFVTFPDYNVNLATIPSPNGTADPGTGQAIPVTASASISLNIGTGAETNTLADPPANSVGRRITLVAGVVGGGTRAVTVAGRVNQANNTILTFGAVGDFIELESILIGATPRWQVVANDGVALS